MPRHPGWVDKLAGGAATRFVAAHRMASTDTAERRRCGSALIPT
jgi:hypothetical protein